jgi:Ca2+-binding RTX toxin-like protein
MRQLLMTTVLALLCLTAAASASHIPGQPCSDCASHAHWPTINGIIVKAGNSRPAMLIGTGRRDELLGHHGSDYIHGKRRADILWGDWQGGSDQPTDQHDEIHGGGGNDFIYGSHGRNVIYGGAGNDAISVHFGRGSVDCGSGRDIYHVAKSRKRFYRFKNCERVDYRSESQRGGGLRPLH